MIIDKYFHLYGEKDSVNFVEIPKPTEQNTAEWKYNGYGFWVCTNCGYPLDDTYYAGNYCLNCGHRIKRGEEE